MTEKSEKSRIIPVDIVRAIRISVISLVRGVMKLDGGVSRIVT